MGFPVPMASKDDPVEPVSESGNDSPLVEDQNLVDEALVIPLMGYKHVEKDDDDMWLCRYGKVESIHCVCIFFFLI